MYLNFCVARNITKDQLSTSRRTIRSYVRRRGKLSKTQKRGLADYTQHFGLSLSPVQGQFDFEQVYQTSQPVILEIGFGRGDSLFEMAQANPENNYLGIEVYEAGIGQLISRLEDMPLANLKVIAGDALLILSNYIGDDNLAGVQIFFPDPWPKKKHHKRRLINRVSLDLLARKLVSGGFLHVVTDWTNYAKDIDGLLSKHADFIQALRADAQDLIDHRAKTKYEYKARRRQHQVWEFVYYRV